MRKTRTVWTIDPKIPLGLWWALVAAAVAAVAWYAIRPRWHLSVAKRLTLTFMLLAGLMGPLLVALNPTWVEVIPPLPGQPMLTVLVDATRSMNIEDVGTSATSSRWDKAVELAKQIDASGTAVDVRRGIFGEDQVSTLQGNESRDDLSDNTASGHKSDLAEALTNATRTGSPLGHAVFLISDGAHNVGSIERVLRAAREANALATPIYTMTLGTSVGMKNLALNAKSPRMIAFPDRPVTIQINVVQNGLEGLETKLTLMRGDNELQTQTVRLQDPSQEVRFQLPQGVESSLERFRVVASSLQEEATTADNQTTVLVQRLNAPIGVLVLEGKPYWDSKFLTRNLAQDPVVEMTSVVRVGSRRFLRRRVDPPPLADEPQGDSEAIADSDAEVSDGQWSIAKELDSPLESKDLLAQYRVVVLGRDADAYLTQKAIDNLRFWISNSGGCLLCARGAPVNEVTSKLAEVLPVRWGKGNESRFRTRLSSFGMDSAIFDPLVAGGQDVLGTLPSLATSGTPKARAGLPQVLVQSTRANTRETIPVVTYQPYGSGLSVVVEGAGMWRWAFLPPEHAEKDLIYPTLWQSLVQWIVSQQDVMPGQDIAVRPDRASFLSGDPTTATVILKEPEKWQESDGELKLSALLSTADQELPKRLSLTPSQSEPGMYRIDMETPTVGYYTLKIVEGDSDEVQAATAFEVRDPWFESLEVDARPDLMRRVSVLSGGKVIEEEDVAGLVKQFADKLKQEQQHEERRTTMWDRPLVLLLILGAWITTWIVRRQSGLT